MASVRIDKWLWAARFFKTRALAQKSCELGRIHSNDVQAKPAREVRVGDMLQIKHEGGEFHIEAMQEFAPLPDRRPTKRDRRHIIQFRRER
jgi:ribosome-associated heat shock protein Hsp15